MVHIIVPGAKHRKIGEIYDKTLQKAPFLAYMVFYRLINVLVPGAGVGEDRRENGADFCFFFRFFLFRLGDGLVY